MPLTTHPNPDLTVQPDGYTHWNSAPWRRHGFHNLHRLTRYAQSFRAARVLDLQLATDIAIPLREDVQRLTGLPWFSAMAVTEGNRILFERYAPDFGPDQPHSIMSISKLATNLITGRLWEDGKLDLDEATGAVLPWIGAGYRDARLQDVLNMNVKNGYDEDYSNPASTVFQHEAVSGMRLSDAGPELPNQAFIAGIGLAAGARDTVNDSGSYLYKSANTDVLGFAAEARGGRPLGQWLADLADAAGVEGALHVLTDRTGFPLLSGGICLTARDLCRYGAMFVRMGAGIDGRPFGSEEFIRRSQSGGIPMAPPRQHLRYSNQTNTDGTWVGHGGYGGQYMVANPATGRVAVFFSVLDDFAGYNPDYYPPIIAMLADICAR
jgi:CubicO group peptidase (beta-lactamase class C family)